MSKASKSSLVGLLLLGFALGEMSAIIIYFNLTDKLETRTEQLNQVRDSLALSENENLLIIAQRDSAIRSAQQLSGTSDTECKEALKFLRDMWPVVEGFKNGMDDAIAKNPHIVGEPTITTKTYIKRIK